MALLRVPSAVPGSTEGVLIAAPETTLGARPALRFTLDRVAMLAAGGDAGVPLRLAVRFARALFIDLRAGCAGDQDQHTEARKSEP